MGWPDPPVLAALVASSGVAFGGWLTWLASGASRLMARVESLEGKVATLLGLREADALIKRRMGDHIDKLEHHIWTGKPPPPPERPVDI